MKKWYEQLFENYSNTYDKEFFTQGTIGECDFLEKELNFDKSKTILDVGCGTGRHSIELAKRGYNVTGIDLSENQLQKAREKAQNAGLKIDFIQADAREFSLGRKFDFAIMLCEGGFSLMETDEMNFAILSNSRKHLNDGGKYIFTCLSALFPLYHSVKDFHDKNLLDGTTFESNFNIMTFRDYSDLEFTDDDGNKHRVHCNERYYAPSEITWLLKTLDFRNIDIMGCDIGIYERGRPLTTDNYEMLVSAEL